jgi:hypothetical protein
MLIVGSKAFCKIFNSDRSINDIDIIGTKKHADILVKKLKPKKIKDENGLISLISIDKNSDFDKENLEILVSDDSVSLKSYLEYEGNPKELKYASAEVLFSLKKSHIHFPIKFSKHISDYCKLYDHLNGVDVLSGITKINFTETENRIGKLKTPSLNKSVKKFFGQSNGLVKSYFIHDDMHMAVAHYDRPLYERMQKDLELAKCDKNLWNDFSFEDKCKCVLEEAYVISLERKILPMLFGKGTLISSLDSLDWALMRICTTLCSGWFRSFATDNFFRIKQFSNLNYVEDFLEKYQNGEIKRI